MKGLIFPIVSFLSAFLLFVSEPMVAKQMLPSFGSSSSTWIVSILFFQLMLFLGYVYSYKIISLSSNRQKLLHMSLVLCVLVLQIIIASEWPSPIMPTTEDISGIRGLPETKLLLALLISIGALFFLLSTTNTLIHAWYAKAVKKTPYWLYRVSNAGSLLGLLAYPFLVEPRFSLHNQGKYWFLGFLVFAGFLLISSFSVPQQKTAWNQKVSYSRNKIYLWIFLAAVPSFVMLSFTNHLTQSISPIPLLWILPLAIYLMSFVVGFRKNLSFSSVAIVSLLVSSLLVISIKTVSFKTGSLLILDILFYCLTLFLVSLVSHHFLYRNRPIESNLGIFYIMISLGGLVGSFLVAIIAPLMFRGFWEVEISLFLSLTIAFYAYKYQTISLFRGIKIEYLRAPFIITSLVMFVFLIIEGTKASANTIMTTRNFYGVLSVTKKDGAMYLKNGSIIHGSQYLDKEKVSMPTTYFGEGTGPDVSIRLLRGFKKEGINVGIIGLGVGTIASYCKPEDELVFYEINPQVVEIANSYFSFLSMCPQAEVVVGDARISLGLESARKDFYDILIIDAFTDDAIPIHLLTEEAFELYLSRLSGDGVLAVHISNNVLDLRPPIVTIANKFGLQKVVVTGHKDQSNNPQSLASVWVLLSEKENIFDNLQDMKIDLQPLEDFGQKPLWTDDYSSILPLVKL